MFRHDDDRPPDRWTTFGPKTGWIAVRGVSADAVVQALGLRDVRPAAWDDGIEAAYDGGVFVGPPVDEWVLAAGNGILTGWVDLAALSRRLDPTTLDDHPSDPGAGLWGQLP
jgi:hypothetical protein